MLPIEEVKKWLIENRVNKNGDLDLSGLDLSFFEGNVLASGWKVKGSLDQSYSEVGGDLYQGCQKVGGNLSQGLHSVGGILRQDSQTAKGRIIQDLDSLHNDFAIMSPAERGNFIIHLFGDNDDGKIMLNNVDMSCYGGNVDLSLWKVGGDLYQSHQEVKGDLHQDSQKVEGAIFQDPIQGKKQMTPKEKGQFLLEHFKGEDGALELSHVDLSDFEGDVVVCGWKVGGDLFLDHQEVGGSLYQDNQKVRLNLFQDKQEVGWRIMQDEQKIKDACKDACVEPNYKAEWEKMKKELYEADNKIEALMWALGKAKEAGK